MEKLGALVAFVAIIALVFLLVGGFLLNGLAKANDAQAQRIEAHGRARSAIIEAQGQARLDSAQAFAITVGASLPWMVIFLVTLSGMALLASILAIFILTMGWLRDRHIESMAIITSPSRFALPAPEQPALVIPHDMFETRREVYIP